jgi:ribonuclease-3
MNIKNLAKLEDKIGISFNHQNHLIEALSHISYLSENPNFKDQFGLIDGHNERLEHFGDSVLDLIIAENLFNNYPGREGGLSKIKEHFAKGDKSEKISDKIGLEEFLIMGIGESKNKMGRKKRIKNSLEALIAAIFIDQGYDKAKEFVNKFFLYDLDNILEIIF